MSCNSVTLKMDNYKVHGIDVSHYQSYIDWSTVAEQDIDFAFVKATEGESLGDSLFAHNWAELKRVNIRRGAYHFFRPTSPAINQALNFISKVDIQEGDLPPVVDVEVADGVSPVIVVQRLRSWLELVEREYNIRPIIYTNQKYYSKFIAGNFDDYPLWIARYSKHTPRLNLGSRWTFWQYGDTGRMKGIQGDVDFNVFHGELTELEALCLPESRLYSSLD
ncbi:MAG: GH25 family lysozyme [Bacteroidota bacterium]